MVDYSKFDHIGSSDESDAAHPVSIQQTCDAMFDSIRRVGPGQPKGFYYPLQGGDMAPFDVRDEIRQDFGYQHGDVVVTDHGHISTVIGVFDEQLWFHAEGNDGADLWTNEVLKKVGRTAVEERAKGPPSLKSDWLRLDFAYAAGLENPTLAYFDTRKHLCETVGGFKHGDVIRVGAISAVTIGVKRDGHRLFLWFHPPHSPGARIFQVEDLRGSRVIDRKAVREHPRPHAVPAPANKKAAECAPMGIKAAQRDSDTNKAKLVAKLVAERGAREEAERKLREAEKEVDKMRKKLDRLRSKNSSLAKASATSERNTERKFLLKREQVRKELEVETSQKLMNELIQPQLDDLQKKERILQQEQAVVARERHSISEQSFELEAKKRQLQQRLESNDVDTQRLREELKRREAESLRLRSETKHLEQRIHEEKAARVAEKAELVRQLRSQPPASVDEETWQYQNDEGDWVSYSSRSNDELMGALKEGKKSIILTIDQKGYEVDFTLMKQMNQRTEKRRSIRLFFGLPNHWGMTDEDALKLLKGEVQDAQEASDASVSMGTVLTTISEGTRMAMRAPFKKFVRKVQDLNWLSELESLLNSSALRHDQSRCHCPHGDSKYRLLEAYQVRNLYLWRRYQRFVRNLGDKQNQHGIVPEEIQPPVCEALTNFAEGLQVDLPCNERLLFHGTMKFGYAKAIAVEGFDNRIARQGLYGKGTYFASQTCKSAQYATKRGRAEKASHRMPGTMLVARVALGDPYYTEGKYNESRPPTKNSHPVDDSDDERTVLCDSLIARPGIQAGQHPQAHMEFVTFAPEQAYPEFILRFVEED